MKGMILALGLVAVPLLVQAQTTPRSRPDELVSPPQSCAGAAWGRISDLADATQRRSARDAPRCIRDLDDKPFPRGFA